MKVYLHFESVGDPSFSVVQEINEKSFTFIDLLNNFVSEYNMKHPQLALIADDLCLFSSEGRRLTSPTAQVVSEVCSKDDVIVTRKKDKKSSYELVAKGATDESKLVDSINLPQKLPILKSTRSSTFKNDVEALINARSFLKARLLCEKCIHLKTEESCFFLGAIARIKLRNNQIDAAVKYAKKAVVAAASCGFDTNVFNLTLAQALYLSADAYDEAEEILDKLQSLSVNHPKSFILDVRTLRAECLFDLNQHEAAANLVNEHMNWEGALDHLPTLVAYSRFAMTYRKVEEPLRAMLKAVVIDQKSAQSCKMLAELLSSNTGYSELNKQVPPSLVTASAYAYLAMTVKEFSAIDPCIRLLSEALRFKPQSASFALNLCHAYEIRSDYTEALRVIKDFCSFNLTLKVGLFGFTCADLLAALNPSKVVQDCTIEPSLSRGFETLDEAKQNPKARELWSIPIQSYVFSDEDSCEDIKKSANIPGNCEKYSTDDMDLLAIAFTAVKISYLAGNIYIIPALHRLIEPTRRASSEQLHLTSIRNECAYYRCIIKVFVHRGVAVDVPVSESDPPVISSNNLKGSSKPLNSAAISPDGAMIVRSRTNCLCDGFWSEKLSVTPKQVHEACERPIFIVGDSHCMSLAWSIIHLKDSRKEDTSAPGDDAGSSRLLVPRLVTGVKQWHLRSEGTFYPKANFHHTVENIPSGSDVIFLIGEIDVREGFWKSVERDRYDSLAEGMERTVDIYTKVLLKILSTKKFTIFIHPIAPVLDETRSMVKQFNIIFERKVKALKGLNWLDFFPALLNNNQDDLNDHYKMDGTHLNPNYLGLVESELQKYYNQTC